MAKLPTDTGAFLPYVAAGYCDPQHRQDVQSFFEGRSTKYTGGPRILAQVLEGIDLCVAYKTTQAPSVAEFLQNYKASSTSVATASEAAKFEPLNFSGGGSRQGIDAHKPFGKLVVGEATAQEIFDFGFQF